MMSYFIWKRYPTVQVGYKFKNRSLQVRLGDDLDLVVLAEQIAALRSNALGQDEIQFILKEGDFTPDFGQFLENLALPEVHLESKDGWLNLTYEGLWASTVLLETPLLALVNENYFADVWHPAEAMDRLVSKVEVLKANPQIRFVEFGTRRRASALWQETLVDYLAQQLPPGAFMGQFLGTSNTRLARLFDLPVAGTMAHQLFMVTAALAQVAGNPHPLITAENTVLDGWAQTFAPKWWTALTDTFSSEHFLTYQSDRLAKWNLRQDSGNPFAIGDMYLRAFDAIGLTTFEKSTRKILFSNSLDLNTMLALHHHFGHKVITRFGWGTDLTCDSWIPALNIVIKPEYVRVGPNQIEPCVKLTDDLSKAVGDPETINIYKHEAQYGKLVV